MARRALALFLPVAAVACLAAGLTYASVQHVERSDANDPQIQMAEDAAAALDGGATPSTIAGTGTVDLTSSLAPFIAVYDANGAVLASDGSLDGHPPVPPAGVLEAARTNGLDTVTWQPRPGARFAIAVVPWAKGTVLAGRSLRLVEQRESDSLLLVLLGLIVMLAGAAVASIVGAWLWDTGRPPTD